MRTREKARIVRDFERGDSVIRLALRYIRFFPHIEGGWDAVCLEIEKILREAYK
jgi:hypothetical protein